MENIDRAKLDAGPPLGVESNGIIGFIQASACNSVCMKGKTASHAEHRGTCPPPILVAVLILSVCGVVLILKKRSARVHVDGLAFQCENDRHGCFCVSRIGWSGISVEISVSGESAKDVKRNLRDERWFRSKLAEVVEVGDRLIDTMRLILIGSVLSILEMISFRRRLLWGNLSYSLLSFIVLVAMYFGLDAES